MRQVGSHPVLGELAAVAQPILDGCPSPEIAQWKPRLLRSGRWDGIAFVDFCRHCAAEGDPALIAAACRLQRSEFLLLLRCTWNDVCA
jgi:hypothetical protein